MKAAVVDRRVIASTGVAGLDDILAGGLTRERIYLVEGTPGTGKTTLGLGFLLAGARTKEAGLYITLAETETELLAVAESHGWSLDAINLVEMVPADGLGEDQEQTLLHPSEVELGETVRDIMIKVDEVRPSRVVIDSLSELRLRSAPAIPAGFCLRRHADPSSYNRDGYLLPKTGHIENKQLPVIAGLRVQARFPARLSASLKRKNRPS